jgi:hypothetical protein
MAVAELLAADWLMERPLAVAPLVDSEQRMVKRYGAETAKKRRKPFQLIWPHRLAAFWVVPPCRR